MCGILGHIDLAQKIERNLFAEMLDTLRHRGPDDEGIYIDNGGHIALGHRRLSFIDLGKSGQQPLCDVQEKIHITFNGEIYNYLELKKELSACHFQTNTDTEVLIAAYKKWGIGFVNKLKGMFAFALLDQNTSKLYLVRDRFGIKPMYYYSNQHQFVFASELKAIVKSGIPAKEIDYTSFADYFVYRYIPSPKTIWKNISKVPAAHFLTLDTGTLEFSITEYWKLKASNRTVKKEALVKHVDQALVNAVNEHVRADVPVGAFLSGGYDSSALVSYMKQTAYPPHTFSIGFKNWEKSEDQYAKIVAQHLHVENDSVVADHHDMSLLERMPDVYDEPIADISIIPTYMVSALARKKVKAVLSGEGADEVFAGYTWQHEYLNQAHPEGILQKINSVFSKKDPVGFYAGAMAMGMFDDAELKKLLHPNLHQYIAKDVHWFYRKNYDKSLSPLRCIQYMDIKCFMGELVLTKIDRASMANSLEVRVPFLDHELVELVFGTREEATYDRHQTKVLLYENIKERLPEQILHRKKQGFVGPDSYYMNLDFYREQLENSVLVSLGLVNRAYIDALLKETYNWKLWKILVMEKWAQKWMG